MRTSLFAKKSLAIHFLAPIPNDVDDKLCLSVQNYGTVEKAQTVSLRGVPQLRVRQAPD
jgi:hypothetical protein